MTEEIRTVLATIQPTVSPDGVDKGVAEVSAKLKMLERAADGTFKAVEKIGTARVAGEAQRKAAEKTLRQFNDLARDTLKYEKALEQLQRVMEAMTMQEQISTLDGINARYRRLPESIRLVRADLAALATGAKSQAATMQASSLLTQRATEALTESIKKQKLEMQAATAVAERSARIKAVAPTFDLANQSAGFKELGESLRRYQQGVDTAIGKLDRFGTAMATLRGQKDAVTQAFKNGTIGLDGYTRSMASAVAAEKQLIAEQAKRNQQAGTLGKLQFDGKFETALAGAVQVNWQRQLEGLVNYQRELREAERLARISKLAPDLDMSKFNQNLNASMNNLRKLLAEADAAKSQADFNNFMSVRGPPATVDRAKRQADLDSAFGAQRDAEALQQLIAVTNGASAAQQKLQAQMMMLNRAFNEGRVTADQYRTTMSALRESQPQLASGSTTLAGALGNLDKQTTGLYQKNLILRSSFINAFQSIAAGQPVMSSLFVQATQSIGAFGNLSIRFLAVAAASAALVAGVAAVGTAVATVGDRAVMAEGRLKSFLDNAQEARRVFDNLQTLGQTTGVSGVESTSVFSRLMIGGEQIGATTRQMEGLLETFQKLGILSSATNQELVAGMRQFTQALGKGKLDGDELRSVLENVPEVMRLIGRETGKSIEELRKMGEEGQLTSRIIFDAMLRGAEETNRRFAQLPVTMNLAFNRTKNAMEAILIELNRMTGASERLAQVLAGVAGKLTEFALWLKAINEPGNATLQLSVNTSDLERAQSELTGLQRRMTELNNQRNLMSPDTANMTQDQRRARARALSTSIIRNPGELAAEQRAVQERINALEARVAALRQTNTTLNTQSIEQRDLALDQQNEAEEAAALSAAQRENLRLLRERREENDKLLRGVRTVTQIEQEHTRARTQVEAERRTVAAQNLVAAERLQQAQSRSTTTVAELNALQTALTEGREREAFLAAGLLGLDRQRAQALAALNREGTTAARRAEREKERLENAVTRVSRRGENQGASDEVRAYNAINVALDAYRTRVPAAQQSTELLTRAQEAQTTVLGNLRSAHEEEMRTLADTTKDLEFTNRIRELEAQGTRAAQVEIDQLTTARQVEQIEMRRSQAVRQMNIDLMASEGTMAEQLRSQLAEVNAQYDRQVAAARAPVNQRGFQEDIQAQRRALDNAVRESGDFFYDYLTGKTDGIGEALSNSIKRGIADALAEEFVRPLLQPLIASIVGQNGIGGALAGALGGSNGGSSGLGSMLGGTNGLSSFLPAGGIGGMLAGANSWVNGQLPGLFSNGNAIPAAQRGLTNVDDLLSSLPALPQNTGNGALSGTFTETVGGAAAGFGIGSALGTITAGGSPARNTNAQIGAALGTAVGAYFGVPMVGGALGGLAGGLFGPGPKTNAYGFTSYAKDGAFGLESELSTTGDGAGGGQKYLDTLKQMKAANEFLATNGLTVNDMRRTIAGTDKMGSNTETQSGSFEEALKYYKFSAGDAEQNKSLETKSFDTLQELVDTVGEMRTLSASLKEIRTPLSDFEKEIISTTKPINDMIEVAKKLGYGESELVAERERVRQEMVRLRDTEIAQSRAELDVRNMRAQGLDALALTTQRQQEANKEIDEYAEKLKDMGLTAEQAAPHVAALTEVLENERKAAQIALSEAKRQAQTGLDQRSVRSRATLSGNANLILQADLFDMTEAFRQETLELEKVLKGLGFSSELTAKRVAQLTEAQNRERQAVEQEFQRQKRNVNRGLEDRLFAATEDMTDPANQMVVLEREQMREREEAVRVGLANIALLEQVHLAEKTQREKEAAEQQLESIRSIGGGIRNYINSLRTGNSAGASPLDRLDESRRLFNQDLLLAKGGDTDALSRITQSADALLEAGKAVYASTTGFQDIRKNILAGLESLPAVKSYDQLIYEELKKLNGSIKIEMVLAAELRLKSEIEAALAFIEVNSATLRAKLEAQEALADIRGVLSQISLSQETTAEVKLDATTALSTIVAAISRIAVATSVTDKARAEATALLQTITGKVGEIGVSTAAETAKTAAIKTLANLVGFVEKINLSSSVTEVVRLAANNALKNIIGQVSSISMSPVIPAAVREAANTALASISGNVASIALATSVTEAVKTAAIARLTGIVGVLDKILIKAGVPEGAQAAASAALASISGVVSLIAVNASVTTAARDRANAALDDIVAVVERIIVNSSVTSAARVAASEALAAISGNVGSIALATSVTDAVKATATARLNALVGRIEAITMSPMVPEAVRISASKALSTIGAAVSSIAVAAVVTDAARAQANAALDDITARVAAISMNATIPEGVRDRANAALGTIAGNVASINLSSAVTEAVRVAAMTRLATITGAVSSISMAAAIPEGIRKAANDALAKISGQVASIAISTAVTDAARARANAALDSIVAKVSAISMASSLPAATRASIVTTLGNISAAVTAINITAAIQNDTAALLTANLSKIVATIDRIIITPGTQSATVAAITASLSSIAANVEQIALAPGVVDAVRNEAAAKLATITGVVSQILMAATLPEGVRKTASTALATISGAVSSIAISTAITTEARLAANAALSKLIGTVSLINMATSVTTSVKERANAALSDIAGKVGSIALATGVTNAVRAAANAALENIIGKVSLISLAPNIPALVVTKANDALSSIVGNVSAIVLAEEVTEQTKLEATAKLAEIVAKVSSITLDKKLVEAVKLEANATLAKLAGIVETIVLDRTLTVDARNKANAVLATMFGVVDKILTPQSRINEARATLLTALGSMTTTLNTVLNSTAANTTKLQLLKDFGNIQSTLSLLTDTSSIPEEQLKVLFNSVDEFTKLMTLQATGGVLTPDQKLILRTEGGTINRLLTSALSGTSALTADQRAILLATQETVTRTLKQQVETTETLLISRSIDDKIGKALDVLNYTVKQHLPFLTRLPDVQAYLFHILQAVRGASGGVRVTTLQSSGSLNGGFAYNGPVLPNQEGWGGNYGGLQGGGWVGNGIWNKDSVLASFAGGGHIGLAGGEFVMNAEAAAMYSDVLPQMNDMDWEPPLVSSPEVVSELRQVSSLLKTLIRGQQSQTQVIAVSGEKNIEGHEATKRVLVETGAVVRLEKSRPK